MKKVEIDKVHNSAEPQHEYVLLKVNEDINLKGLMVIDRTQGDEGLSDIHRHPFIFPNLEVKKGEYVGLTTGPLNGKPGYKKAKLTSGEPLHHFYWGLKTPVWNDKGYEDVELRATFVLDKKKVNTKVPLFPSLQRKQKN